MEILLIGGAQSVGKSTAIYRLVNRLVKNGFSPVAGSIPRTFQDFKVLLKGVNKNGQGIRIIINSPSDTPGCIWEFKQFLDSNGSSDIMISSVRDHDFWPRSDFFNILNLPDNGSIIEIPFGKITRRGKNFPVALNWYETKMDSLIDKILNSTPYNI